MLDRKQRDMVMKLFSDGTGASEIAKKVGVSRQSVYRVIQSDFEEDAEIHALKKQLRKAELQEKIREVRKPSKTSNELAAMKDVIDGLVSRMVILWSLKVGLDKPIECLYCGEVMKGIHRTRGEVTVGGYRCNRCRKEFLFP